MGRKRGEQETAALNWSSGNLAHHIRGSLLTPARAGLFRSVNSRSLLLSVWGRCRAPLRLVLHRDTRFVREGRASDGSRLPNRRHPRVVPAHRRARIHNFHKARHVITFQYNILVMRNIHLEHVSLATKVFVATGNVKEIGRIGWVLNERGGLRQRFGTAASATGSHMKCIRCKVSDSRTGANRTAERGAAEREKLLAVVTRREPDPHGWTESIRRGTILHFQETPMTKGTRYSNALPFVLRSR
jgi:hypothetical protein